MTILLKQLIVEQWRFLTHPSKMKKKKHRFVECLIKLYYLGLSNPLFLLLLLLKVSCEKCENLPLWQCKVLTDLLTLS